jgi:Rrf2 family protein
MKLNRGVEWALHTCLNLGWLAQTAPAPAQTAARLAAFYDLPPAYLNKQLQALTRAAILTSASGPRGGFRLARRLEEISLLDIVVAIEGRSEVFECAQILRDGPNGDRAIDYRVSCLVSQAMGEADLAWRKVLASRTLAEVKAQVESTYPETPGATRAWFAQSGRAQPPSKEEEQR